MILTKVSKVNGIKSECEVATEKEAKFLVSHGWKRTKIEEPKLEFDKPKKQKRKRKAKKTNDVEV